ncbi:MAG: hypothetical protein M8357_08715 [Desulfobulbaceae bacterium]|nr:hypothetical protein [Desulfobulbaceae bacterium]
MDIALSVLKTSCSSSRKGGEEYAFGVPLTEQTAINMPISWKSPFYRYKVLLPYYLLAVIVPDRNFSSVSPEQNE